jgi:hypothetical protein
LDAPKDFKSYRGKEISTFMAETTWTSTLHLPGTQPGIVLTNTARKTADWSNTIFKTEKKDVAQKGYERMVGMVKDCALPGLLGPKIYPPEKNLSLAVWLMPSQNITVEMRNTRLGKDWKVALVVSRGHLTKGAKKSGKQEIKYESGEVYQGPLNAKGQPHGVGRFSDPKSGTSLEGDFVNGKPVPGKKYVKKWADGNRYEGGLDDKAQMHGKGAIFEKNGSQLEGEFKSDKPFGKMTYSNPKTAKGVQQQGRYEIGVGLVGEGQTIIFDPKTNEVMAWAKGNFKKGQPDGVHKLFAKGGILKQSTTYKIGKVKSGREIYGEGKALYALGQAQYTEHFLKTAPFPMNQLVDKARGEMRQKNLRVLLDKRIRVRPGAKSQGPWVSVGTFNVGGGGGFLLSVQADKRKVPGFRFRMKSRGASRRTSEEPCRLDQNNICFLQIRADRGPMDISVSPVGATESVDAHVLTADKR